MASITFVSPTPAPPPEQRPPGQSNLRGAARTRCHSPAQLILYPPGRHTFTFDVTIVDYSATGIGIVHSESLMVGQTYIVRGPLATQKNTCIFTVMRSEQRADGAWSIGLCASNTLADELAPMCEEKPAPGIDIWTKIMFGMFVAAGIAIIIVREALKHAGK